MGRKKKEDNLPSMDIPNRINMRRNKGDKYTWVICIVCDDWCPQHHEGPFSKLDNVHMTCRYNDKYPALAKKLKKQREEETKLSLF